MKAIIVILLLIFASLAFGAESQIPLGKDESLERLDTVIQKGIGKVSVAVIRGEGPGAFYIDVYGSCLNHGKYTPLFKIGSVQKAAAPEVACGYTSSSLFFNAKKQHDDILVGFRTWTPSPGAVCLSDTDPRVSNYNKVYPVDLVEVCKDFQK
jgi:hypothetical protein